MTTYTNVAPSASLAFHDVMRVTFVAPTHWYMTQGAESDWLGQGLANIFAAADAGGLELLPISANTYQPGDLSATIDFLYPSSATLTLADALTQLRDVSRGGGLNFEDLVAIDAVTQVVGGAGAPPGTEAAGTAAYSPESADDRARAQAAADAAAKAAAPDWFQRLMKEIGTAGEVAAVVAVAAIGYGLYRRARG